MADAHNARVRGEVVSAGDRQSRGTKSERSLHAEIFDECRRRGWIALHGSMAERTHRTAGEPDFVILADAGRVFFIECKSAIGKLTVDQLAMRAHAAKLGHKIHIVRSMGEFLDVVKLERTEG